MIGRFIGKQLVKKAAKKVGRTAGKKAMSSAQKAALAKAVKASALARKKGASKLAARRVKRNSIEASAVKAVKGMKVKKVKGFFGERAARKQFMGKAGTARQKATYVDRLNSSRAKYRAQTVGTKLKQAAKGAIPGNTGKILRREYVDLTYAEQVRRNMSRQLKVATAAWVGANVAAAGAVTVMTLNQKRKRG